MAAILVFVCWCSLLLIVLRKKQVESRGEVNAISLSQWSETGESENEKVRNKPQAVHCSLPVGTLSQ